MPVIDRRPALVLSAILLAFAGLPARGQQDPKPDPAQAQKEKDEQKARVDEALKAFAKDYKNADPDARANAVLTHLGGIQDRKMLERAAGILGGEHDKVKIAAAQVLAGFKTDPRMSAAAASALTAAINMNKKSDQVLMAVFKAIGDLGDESAASALHKWIDDNELNLAKGAIEATGKVKCRASIPELINLAQKLERSNVDLTSGGRANAGGSYNQAAAASQEGRKRYDELHPPCMAALRSITGQSHSTSKQWEDWWKKNQSTFVIPGKEPAPKSR